MSDELRRTLDAAGHQDAPAPDPDFVRALAARLAGGVVTPLPARRRPFLPAAAAVLIVAAGIGIAIGANDGGSTDQVRTEPEPSVTTSTLVGTTTSTTAPVIVVPPTPTSTTPTTAATAPTTVAERPHPTTTTSPPPTSTSTSTTAPSAPQDLHLTCTPVAATTSFACSWDRSTSPAFASFRLTRRTHDGPENVVYTGDRTTFTERAGTGARWVYLVTALDAAGRSLGSSTVDVTCC